MTRIAAYVAVAALLAAQAVPLAVAQTQVPQLNPNPQTQGGITYVSGGIADDWQQSMESQRGQYNLHLLFAQLGTGAYFANVPVDDHRLQRAHGAERRVPGALLLCPAPAREL